MSLSVTVKRNKITVTGIAQLIKYNTFGHALYLDYCIQKIKPLRCEDSTGSGEKGLCQWHFWQKQQTISQKKQYKGKQEAKLISVCTHSCTHQCCKSSKIT